jgi:hypothetical protein
MRSQTEERMKRLLLLVSLLVFGTALAQSTEEVDDRALDILALSQEFDTIGTETYYLAPVENSGVDGHV